MKASTSCYAVALAASMWAAPTRLATNNTSITVQADPSAPRLLQLADWNNGADDKLIDHVYIDDTQVPVKWQYMSSDGSQPGKVVRYIYESGSPHLRLYWDWRVRAASGPIEHTIRIENLSGKSVLLPLQDSFQYNFQVPRAQPVTRFWVEKGASSPSAEGTHIVPLKEGEEWTGTSSTYAHPPKGAQREMIPYLLVERDNASHSGWYTGIEFSGRTRITVKRAGDSLLGEAGLNPEPGPYRTRLNAGETFETPTVFVGAFDGGPDGAANILRRWIRATLNNPLTLQNAEYPLLVSNSWGSGMAINETQAHQMIQDAAGLGLEMFHLDAGWFRTIGDWVSDPKKFPDGVSSVADYAHQKGLKFGLWTDWTQAGLLNVHDPEIANWLTVTPPPDWQPAEFKGITIDIGVPAARNWAAETVRKIVQNYHIDMLEHDGYLVAQGCERDDHPHVAIDRATAKHYKDEDFLWVDGSNDTDVSYFATRAYYDVQSQTRKRFPALLFEICNDGGRMVDFGSAAHGDYFSITDAYDPVSNRRAFYDASYVLPPAMLETYVEKWPVPRIQNFRYMLRSGFMGWFSLMLDSNTWSPEQHEVAKSEFALYKERLRPLIREADLYHVSDRADGVNWDGMEYFDATRRQGVLYAFRGSGEKEQQHAYRLKGLQPKQIYKLTFHDHSSLDLKESGERLMRVGVQLHESVPNSSELVFIEAQ